MSLYTILNPSGHAILTRAHARFGVNSLSIALGAIFLVGLLVRLYCVDCRSLWFDEIASIEVAQRGLSGIFTDRFGWLGNQTVAHYLLVWLTIQLVDPTVSGFLVRLLPALLGALSPLVVYGLGKEIFGRAQGVAAAVLMALAPVHIEYSQDGRPYALLLFFTALSIYCLLVALRTGSPRWWAGFALATVANLLNSYSAVSLVLPALSPYLLWALWALWRRGQLRKALVAVAGALAAVGVVALLQMADLAQVSRTPPRLDPFPLSAMLSAPMHLVTWFTQIGINPQVEKVSNAALIMLSVLGAFAALRSGRLQGVSVCLLMILAPSAILAVLSTSGVVYQRYVLFSMPFYFLLVGHGAVMLFHALKRPGVPNVVTRGLRTAAAVLAGAYVALLAAGASMYIVASQDQPLLAIDRPDFRQGALYLTRNATPDDIIIFAGWDPTPTMFYWKDRPPTRTYSILDPRIFGQRVEGSIYWVVSYDSDLLLHLAQAERWSQAEWYHRMVILREDKPRGGVEQSMDRFVSLLEAIEPRTRALEQTVMNLRGSVEQGRGRIEEAARAYRRSGTYFPLGQEYLRSSRGFAAHGELAKAWREALISKSTQPHLPELHEWMAQLLAEMGLDKESQVERQLAGALHGGR